MHSGFLEAMAPHLDVTVLLPPSDQHFRKIVRDKNTDLADLPASVIPRSMGIFEGLISTATHHRCGIYDPVKRRWMLAFQPRWKQPYSFMMGRLARLISYSPLYETLERRGQRKLKMLLNGAAQQTLLDTIEPDVVLTANPWQLAQREMSFAAMLRGIPTMTTIPSWDNLCQRSHLVADYAHYIVWSEMMRQDLLNRYPDLEAQRISVTGTPQFDYHLRKELWWDRAAFFKRIGGDPNRKLLVYAAQAREVVFPKEDEFVAQLWQAIEHGRIEGKPQLLVRSHPLDRVGRFRDVEKRCPGIIIHRAWQQPTQQQIWFTPELDDLAMLTNTMRHMDVNINMASSVTLDAAIFDKPIVNVGFTPAANHPHALLIRHAHKLLHFRRVMERKASRLATSMDELVEAVNLYLRNPDLDREGRRRAAAYICGPIDGKAHERIVDSILTTLQRSKKGHNAT